jgi:hypothetical protein
MLLNGVSTGLVECVHLREIVVDRRLGEGTKQNIRADREDALTMTPQMNQADPSDDLMRAALKFFQHPPRVGEIARLAQNFIVQKNQRVRSEHERVGKFFGDGARLAMRIQLAEFQWRKMFMP